MVLANLVQRRRNSYKFATVLGVGLIEGILNYACGHHEQEADAETGTKPGENIASGTERDIYRMHAPVIWLGNSGGPTLVLVMQSAYLRDGNDPAGISCLHWSGFRRILGQGQVRTRFVIVRQEQFYVPI